jgi:hypothetical protein
MRLPTLLLIAALTAACGAAERAPAPVRASVTAGDTTIVIAGPALVALIPAATQAQLDADEGLASTLDDFGHYLAEATPALRAAGVTVHGVTGRRAHLVSGDPPRPLAAIAADAPRHVLVAPGRAPQVLEGVRTDDDLLRAAALYFRIPALPSGAP